MPGKGRWEAVAEELRECGQDGREVDERVGNFLNDDRAGKGTETRLAINH